MAYALTFAMKKTLFSIVLFVLFLAPKQSHGNTCSLTFKIENLPQLSVNAIDANRVEILDFARVNNLPAFSIELNYKNIPVILLNKKTLEKWSWVLSQSMGMVQSMNPGNPANHGYFRMPGESSFHDSFVVPGELYFGKKPTAGLMDLFSPAKAGSNAAANTGYRFKSIPAYFEKREHTSTEFVDLAYVLNREDQIRVWLYHAAKRTALVRIQYAFDTPNNAWAMSQRRMLQKDNEPFTNILKGGFEHCNNSRCGQNADMHVQEMRGRVASLLNKDANFIFGFPETQKFLDDAKRDLLFRDWRDSKTYEPDFLNRDHYIGLMQSHFKKGLSREDKVDALSYLMAINIFEEMIQIKNRLGIQESRANQYDNFNISAIFIYSDRPETVDNFYRGRLQLQTAPLENGNNGFDTSYFKSSPIYPSLPSQDTRRSYQP